MRMGFSFKGQHSNDFSVTVRTNDRPIRPEMKDTTYNPTNADGEYSFAAANPSGHEYYNGRVFELEIGVIGKNLSDLQSRLARLSRWLMGSGVLIFDDTPLVKWNARIVEAVSYTPEHYGKEAKLVVKYKVEPFSSLVFDTIDGPCLDDELELDSDVPLDIGEYFRISGAGTNTVKNIGDMPVRPVITVSNATKTVALTVNGITLTVPKSAVIDCEKYIVTSSDGESLMNKITGDFFELMPGDNDITVVSDEAVTLEIRYEPKYIHNVDTEDMRLD